MRIMMLLNAGYPLDIRVEKEAVSLMDAGFWVDIVCNRRKNEAPFEKKGRLTIHRINTPAKDQKLKHGIYDALAAINFVHPVFRKALKKLVHEQNPDAIHVHDLPLAKTGILAARDTGIPVVLDLHENYPDALKVWFQWKPKGIATIKDRLLFTYDRWFKQEAWACREADYIIAVADEMKRHLMDKHDLKPEEITVITNTEKKSFSKLTPKGLTELKKRYEGKYVLSYIGGMGPHRGLDTVLEGMPEVVKNIPNAHLLLVGRGAAGVVPRLKDMVEKLDIEDYVTFVGHVPFDEVPAYMKLSNINLVPHNSNSHTDNTIPHKLFQIMLVEGNLLVSSSPPLKRVVTKANSGFVFEADNSESFAQEVIFMHANPELVKERTKNGFDATMKGPLNWAYTAEKLVDFYQEILQ